MVSWSAFEAANPELAAIATRRIDDEGLVLVGTLRRNGWPRISPVEPLFVDGQLELGMMWRSKKALDLLADPRPVVHSTVSERAGTEGDVKVYGRAVPIGSVDERERYGRALEARIGWRPDRDFHLFKVDVTEVGYFVVADGGHRVRTWKAP